jgi:hypothetical protein
MDTSDVRTAYELAARVGSLEGYLYSGRDIEEQYLPGWLSNLEREFNELSPEVRGACAELHHEVLRKVAAYLKKFYGVADVNALKAQEMVNVAQGVMDSEG